MKRKKKLIIFYIIVVLLFMGTPFFLLLLHNTNESIKMEVVVQRILVRSNSELSETQKSLRDAEIDKKELYLKSKKNLWIRGAILFSLSAIGLLMYRNQILPKEAENKIVK